MDSERIDAPCREQSGPTAVACDRREEILAEATRLFAEQGYTDAVTQQLADRLQVGKGTLYRYFPSKRELFLAACDRVMSLLQQHTASRIRGVDDPLEQVKRGIRAYLQFFADHPDFVELLIQERAQFKGREKPTYIEHRERIVVHWRQLYRKLIEEGKVREMPVERITDVIASALYGAIFLQEFAGKFGAFRPARTISRT